MSGLSTKGQFFVVATVFIAIALTAIVAYLEIPEDISYDAFYNEENLLNSVNIVQKSINNLLKSSYSTWWNPYYKERIKIVLNETKNSESNFINYAVNVDFPDDIDTSSVRLIDGNARMPYNVYWTNESGRVGDITFQTAIDRGEKKTLYLYYNKESDTDILDRGESDTANIRMDEFATNITINTQNYQAVLNKSLGGAIISITAKNIVDNLVYNQEGGYRIQSMFICNGTKYMQENDTTPLITVLQNTSNLLALRITGNHTILSGREFYTQDQLYYSDRIKINEKIRWTDNINCQAGPNNTLIAKIAIDATNIDTYKDNDTTGTGTYEAYNDRPGAWADYSYSQAGVSLIIHNESKFASFKRTSSATNKSSELILLNNTILTAQTVEYSYTIYPHRKDWTELQNYYNLTNISQVYGPESYSTYTANLKNSLKSGLSTIGYTISIDIASNEITQTYRNQKDWYNGTFLPNYRKIMQLFAPVSAFNYPVKFSAYLEKNVDYNSLFVSDDAANILATQIISANQTSSFNVYCQNPVSTNYNNYTYYTFNPDGRNFTATITLDTANTFNTSIEYPNGTCIVCNVTLSATTSYLVDASTIKGFYKIAINRTDDKYFQVSTTLPYTVLYNQRLRCKATDTIEPLYFHALENSTQVNISVKALSSNANARIKTLDGDILLENNTITSGTTYNFIVPVKQYKNGQDYFLEYQTNGDVEITLNGNVSYALATNYSHFIDYDAPKLDLMFRDNIEKSKRYYIYYDKDEYRNPLNFTTDLSINKNLFQVNNTFLSWDFDNYNFSFKNGPNWFASDDKWLTDFGNSSNVASTSNTTLTSFEILESGPVRARVRAIGNTTPQVVYYFNIFAYQKFITVEAEASNLTQNDITTGPFWRVNNTQDNSFYAVNDEIDEDAYVGLYTIDKTNFTGTTINWVGKRNNNTLMAMVMSSAEIVPSNRSAQIVLDRITIALTPSKKSEFHLFFEEYTNLTRWDSVRNFAEFIQNPYNMNKEITIATVDAKSKNTNIEGKII